MGDQRSVDGLPCDRRGGVGQSPGASKFAGTQSGLCSCCAAGASRRAGNSSHTKFGICTGTHAASCLTGSAASCRRTALGPSVGATRDCDRAGRANLGMQNEWSEDVFGQTLRRQARASRSQRAEHHESNSDTPAPLIRTRTQLRARIHLSGSARACGGRISGDGGISGVRGISLQPSQKTRSRASALSSPSRGDTAENPVAYRPLLPVNREDPGDGAWRRRDGIEGALSGNSVQPRGIED